MKVLILNKFHFNTFHVKKYCREENSEIMKNLLFLNVVKIFIFIGKFGKHFLVVLDKKKKLVIYFQHSCIHINRVYSNKETW